MDAGTVKRIESGVCASAAALFAAAAGFALYRWLAPSMVQPQLGILAGVGMVAAFLPCWKLLRLVDRRESGFHIPHIDLSGALTSSPAELVLTDADRLDDVLLLDDVVASIGPDSRVVRLFDPTAMPTPGQLKARIDRHLDRAPLDSATPDDSQALFDALSELRLGLR
jgi:hypothetical protein